MNETKRARRLLTFRYTHDNSDADAARLKTCLEMCCLPYKAYREYEFVGGNGCWRFYVDRRDRTWDQVMREINRVNPAPYRFVNDRYIENGEIYVPIYPHWQTI